MRNRCATGSWLMALTVLFTRLGMLGGMRFRPRRGLLRSGRRCGRPRWLRLLRCPALLDRRRTLLNRRTLLDRLTFLDRRTLLIGLTLLVGLTLLISGLLNRLTFLNRLTLLISGLLNRLTLLNRLMLLIGGRPARGASRFACIGAVHRATPHSLYHAGSGECGGTRRRRNRRTTLVFAGAQHRIASRGLHMLAFPRLHG